MARRSGNATTMACAQQRVKEGARIGWRLRYLAPKHSRQLGESMRWRLNESHSGGGLRLRWRCSRARDGYGLLPKLDEEAAGPELGI